MGDKASLNVILIDFCVIGRYLMVGIIQRYRGIAVGYQKYSSNRSHEPQEHCFKNTVAKIVILSEHKGGCFYHQSVHSQDMQQDRTAVLLFLLVHHTHTYTEMYTRTPLRQLRSPTLALPQDMRGSCVSQAQSWRSSPHPPPYFLLALPASPIPDSLPLHKEATLSVLKRYWTTPTVSPKPPPKTQGANHSLSSEKH